MPFRRIPFIFILCLTCWGLSSCLVKRRLITRAGAKPSQTLLLASRAELEQKIVEQYEAIHDFSATVDMTPALGTTEKSQITEFKDVRGFIVFRKPADAARP